MEQTLGETIGLSEDWRIVEELLPDRWKEMARELGALQRARGIADARALLQVMLIHLGEGCGLRETAARAALAGIADVSDVALLKRLRSCGPWFEWLAQALRQEQGQASPSGLLGGRQLRVVDGSVVREPGPTGSQWRLHYASWPAALKVKAERGGQRAHQITGRLCAVRKSAASAAPGRDRVRRESMRGRTRVQPQTLEAAEYILVFTTLGSGINAEQVMALYRQRWQIELEFKRLKSLIQLGHLKKHDARAARSWLQGKLLVAALVTRLIAHAERVSPWGYEISWFEAPPRTLSVA